MKRFLTSKCTKMRLAARLRLDRLEELSPRPLAELRGGKGRDGKGWSGRGWKGEERGARERRWMNEPPLRSYVY